MSKDPATTQQNREAMEKCAHDFDAPFSDNYLDDIEAAVRHGWTARDAEVEALKTELAQEKLVSTRLRSSWREDTEQLKAERDDARVVADGIEEQAKKNSEYDNWRVNKLEEERDQLRSSLKVAEEGLRFCLGKFNAGIDEPDIAFAKCVVGADIARQALAQIDQETKK